jgi:Protein of unknown function (DUF2842)
VLRPALATREIIVPFSTMPMRLRKLIGAFALFILVIVWALLAMAVAQFPTIRDNGFLSVAYYVIAGLGWIVPAMPLVSWMSAPRSNNRSSGSSL